MKTQFTPPASSGQPTASNGYHALEITRAEFEAIADRLDLTIPDGQNRRGPNPFTREGKDGFCFFFPECNGTDREGKFTPSRREMLELAGFSAPISINAPTSQPSAKTDGKEFDTRSLEKRGLTPAARQFFRVSAPLDVESVWGEYRQFPTFHADGIEARHRRKFRDPSRQPTTDRTGKPRRQAKNLWEKATEGKGMPPAYGLNHIEAGETVYLVNSELAVWLFWQDGQRAICPLGEGRSEQSFRAIFQAVKDKGAAELVSMLDADERGQSATETALKAARAVVGLPATAKQWPEGVKIGFDASDFWEECRAQNRDFKTALEGLPDRAKATATATDAEQPSEPAQPRRRFTFFSAAQLKARQAPAALINGVIFENTLAEIAGGHASFKSFVALDMAACVASGVQWQGKQTRRAKVLYIAAEGAAGLKQRVAAWELRHGQEMEVLFLPESVQMHRPEHIEALVWELEQMEEKPGLIVADTLARCFVGGDENSARDAGTFIDGLDALRKATGATILTLHHVGKNGDTRGSTAFSGAFDTIIEAKRENTTVTLRCLKQKDAAEFEPLSLVRRVQELEETDEHDRPLTSLIFEATDAPSIEIPKADQTREQVFQALQNAPEGLSASKWQEASEKQSGIKASRFYDHRDALVKANRVTREGRVYKVTPITPITPNRSQSEPKIYSDYSDDSIESEQSELAGVNGRSSLFQADEAHDPFADVEIEAEEKTDGKRI